MNRLSDLIILDFIEWLWHQLDNDKRMMMKLVFDEKKYDKLMQYAKNFLGQYKTVDLCPERYLLLSFVSSPEFANVCRECDRKEYCREHRDLPVDSLDRKLFCPLMEKAYVRFLRHNEGRLSHEIYGYIDPYILVTSVKLYIAEMEQRQEGITIGSSEYAKTYSYMLNLAGSVRTIDEISFVEWLVSEKGINPSAMVGIPSDQYKKLIDEFANTTGKDDDVRRKLIRAFKQNGWKETMKKIYAFLSTNTYREAVPVKRLIERYFLESPNHYNCIILPLAEPEQQQQYRKLIKEHWVDLHYMTADYLDVYYSEEDKGRTGFDTAQKLDSLPESVRLNTPCIAIWRTTIKDAKSVSIKGLDADQIVEVIRTIVKAICNMDLINEIVDKAVKKVEELRMDNRNIVNNYVNGNNNVVGNSGTTNVYANGNNNTVTMSNDYHPVFSPEDLEKALKAIDSSDELQKDCKNELTKALKEASQLVEEDSEEKKSSAKARLKMFFEGVKNMAPHLLSVLADCATIIAFING